MKSRIRPTRFLAIATALLALAALAGISTGSTSVRWSVIPEVLASRFLAIDGDFTATDEFIVWSVRLPRLLVGMLSGAALAVAGASLQGLFRNPLAGPGIIGASSGAACGAALALVSGPGPAVGAVAATRRVCGGIPRSLSRLHHRHSRGADDGHYVDPLRDCLRGVLQRNGVVDDLAPVR